MNKLADTDTFLASLLTSGALGGLAGAAGGAVGAGKGNRLLGTGAGVLAGIPTGIGGSILGLKGLDARPKVSDPSTALSVFGLSSVLSGGAGGFAAGKGVKAIKESSTTPFNQAFDAGKQKALKESGCNSTEATVKAAYSRGFYEVLRLY